MHAKFAEVWKLERFQTAKVAFEVTQGRCFFCHSIGTVYIRFPINLVREGKTFVKDKVKISSRCKVKTCVFWQVGFWVSSLSKNSVLEESTVRRLESFEGEKCLSQSWVGEKRRTAKCHLHKGGSQGKGRDQGTERGSAVRRVIEMLCMVDGVKGSREIKKAKAWHFLWSYCYYFLRWTYLPKLKSITYFILYEDMKCDTKYRKWVGLW